MSEEHGVRNAHGGSGSDLVVPCIVWFAMVGLALCAWMLGANYSTAIAEFNKAIAGLQSGSRQGLLLGCAAGSLFLTVVSKNPWVRGFFVALVAWFLVGLTLL